MQKKRHTHKKFEKDHHVSAPEKLQGDEREGIIIAHFGASVDVEDSTGQSFHCHLRKNAEPAITGDRVLWRLEKDQTGIVVKILPRKSLLSRPEKNKMKLIAANVDILVIETAPPPLFSERLIDRYIVAAEYLKIQPVILLNKIDLLDEATKLNLQTALSVYEKIGYQVIYSSIYLQNGLNELREFLTGKTSVLVGVSGVGKSSIIAHLTHDAEIRIGEVSESKGSGRHTTTTTRLYRIPEGGSLIDSPGVREFALFHLPPEEVIRGFIDFRPFLGQCKFRNCQHQTEPDCALAQAIKAKLISEARWLSYCEIIENKT
jgi:ribosome biogenesis GTPase